MNNADILTHVKQALMLCEGWGEDKDAADRKAALDYYFMRPRGDEVDGRSQVVTGDVSSMVEAVLAQVLDAYSTSRLVEFGSYGAEDETQAQLESDVVEYVLMHDNDGYVMLTTAIKDALLQRDGWLKIWVEEIESAEAVELAGVEPEVLGELSQSTRPGEERVLKSYDQESKTAKLTVKRKRKRLRAKAVAPENVLYPEGWSDFDLQRIPLFGERHRSTRSELIEVEGFAKAQVERLQKAAKGQRLDAVARDTRGFINTPRAPDKSQEEIEWFECYALLDLDGDGIAERYIVSWSGEELLEKTAVKLVPYIAGTAIINPHRLKGVSLWDKLRQVQDIGTALTRALLDNVNTVTKNMLAYLEGKVDQTDLESGRPNAQIRVRGVDDVRKAISAFNVPDLTQGLLANLQDQRQVRAELGGAALELSTGNMQLNERLGSMGLDRAYSVMERLSALFTKTLAHTLIAKAWLLAHETLRQNWKEPLPIKVNGEWRSPIPAAWPPRACAIPRIGMSPGERQRKSTTLQELIKQQIELTREGLDEVMVDIKGLYRALMDWARVNDIPNPEKYWLNPMSPESQKKFNEKRAGAQQSAEEQRQLVQGAIMLEHVRTFLEKYKADQETAFKYWDSTLDAEVEEAKLAGSAVIDMIELLRQKEENKDVDDSGAPKPVDADRE